MTVDWKGYLIVCCIGAALGIGTFASVAFRSEWMYTEADYRAALERQHVDDLAHVCNVIGKRNWARDESGSSRLRGWGNGSLRTTYAAEVIAVMKIDPALQDRVRAACATRLSSG